MDAPAHGRTDAPLAARLDRAVAETRPHHRLLLLENVTDEAFTVWARARALADPEAVAHLHLCAEGRDLVSGIVAGYEVHGDSLDEALETVLTGRTLVLVAGLDKARLLLGEGVIPWLDWAAEHLPLTVACTQDARLFIPQLRGRAVGVDQIHHAEREDTAAKGPCDAHPSSRTER